jgi:hypothetical protein
MYLFLVLALRLAGKRELAQLNSFDLVVLLLSNTVQNAIIGPDNSLMGGLLGAAVLLAANYTTVRLGFQHPALARALEGTPTTLVQDGRMLDGNLRRYLITKEELLAAIRRQGGCNLQDLEVVVLGGQRRPHRRAARPHPGVGGPPPAHRGRGHPRSGLRARTLSAPTANIACRSRGGRHTYIAHSEAGIDPGGSRSGVRTVGVRPRPADYESTHGRLHRLAPCRPCWSDRLGRPADTDSSCGVMRGGMTNGMTGAPLSYHPDRAPSCVRQGVAAEAWVASVRDRRRRRGRWSGA